MLRLRLIRAAAIAMEWLSFVLLCAWAIGQMTRDRSWFCGLLFYIPTPFVVLLLIAQLPFSRHRKRSVFAGAAVVPILILVFVENQFLAARQLPAHVPAGESHNVDLHHTDLLKADLLKPRADLLKMVHWNVCHPVDRWPAQKEHLLSFDADLIVLSEVTDSVRDSDFPGYQVIRQGTLLLACRGASVRLDHPNARIVPGGVILGFIARCRIDSAAGHPDSGSTVDVLVADHTSNITIPRDPWLKELMHVAESEDVDFIVGDMNAPRRSLAFTNMRAGFQHAYDVSGSGWSYTWPVPVPMLAIDQCIIGKRIACTSYSLDSTTLSDHRLQLIEFQKVQ